MTDDHVGLQHDVFVIFIIFIVFVFCTEHIRGFPCGKVICNKNVFNGLAEIACNVNSENNRGVVFAVFNGANSLTLNAHCGRKGILTDSAFFAKTRNFVFHDE